MREGAIEVSKGAIGLSKAAKIQSEDGQGLEENLDRWAGPSSERTWTLLPQGPVEGKPKQRCCQRALTRTRMDGRS